MSVYITYDQNLKDVSSFNSNAEAINISDGATLTITETPAYLLGDININNGTLLVDGTNITSGNSISFIGSGGMSDGSNDKRLNINGQGTFKVLGDWFDIGTTDGTDSQVIDIGVNGSDYYNGDKFVNVVPMIQIETGRRLNFTSGQGTLPEVNDFVTKVGDDTIMGRVRSTSDSYIVVDLLTGTLADGDEIEVVKVVDNYGPNVEVSWTGTMDGADVKEDGVYMEFGNCVSNGDGYIDDYNKGYGGLVFENFFKSTDITLASSSGGFKPPSGCNIRIPNVNMNTTTDDEFDNGNSYREDGENDENELYDIELQNGGSVYCNIFNIGNADFLDANAFSMEMHYCGAQMNVGSAICASKAIFNHVVVCQDAFGTAIASYSGFGGGQDNVLGSLSTYCMLVQSRMSKVFFGAYTSNDVILENCIHTNPGVGTKDSTTSYYTYYLSKTGGDCQINNCMSFSNDGDVKNKAIIEIAYSTVSISNFRFSSTQDYTKGTTEYSTIKLVQAPNTNIVGVFPIADAVSGNYMIEMLDTSNMKVRAIGMLDRKIDMGSDGEYLVGVLGLCDNIDVARCYKVSGDEHPEATSLLLSQSNVTIQNVSGDYASALRPWGGNGTRFKGVHGGSGNPGTTADGREDLYKGSYGFNFHDGFHSDTKGSVACIMITPSQSFNETTVLAGNPLFYKDGDLDLLDGDSIQFDMGYYAKGHTGFTGELTALIGGGNWGADEISDVDIQFKYQIEGGDWSDWLDARTSSNWTDIPSEMVGGIKLSYKMTANEDTLSISMVLATTTTTIQAQKDNLYPIDQNVVTISLTGLQSNSEVRIYKVSDGSELMGVENSGTSFSDTFIHGGTDFDVDIIIHHLDYKYIKLKDVTLTANDLSIPIQQQFDRYYSNP